MCRLAKAASSGVQILFLPAALTSGAAAAPVSVFACDGAASCRAFLSAYGNFHLDCGKLQGSLKPFGQQPCAGVAVKQRTKMAKSWHREEHATRVA